MFPPFPLRHPARCGLTFGALVLLAACAGPPAPQDPPAVIPDGPLRDLPAGLEQRPLPERWWALFDDAQLNRWVEQALAHNQDLAQAEANVQALLAGIGEIDSRRWPSTELTLGATYGKRSDEQTLAEVNDRHAPSQWQFSPGIELAYQLDLWGQVQASLQRARAQAQAGRAALEQVRLQVATQTTRAYLDHCVASASLVQARQSLDSLERSVRLSERQVQAGVTTQLDSERLLGLREQVRARMPMLEARQQIARFELALLSGQANARPLDRCTVIPTLSAPLPVGDGWHLLQRRPDVRQAERELRAARLQIDIAQADLYPQVSFGAAFTAADSHPHRLGSSRAMTFAIGPLISWQFPNLKANRARLDKARALADGQVAHYRSVALAALKDVREALARYDGERRHVQGLDAALQHSQRGYALADAGYRAGSLDGLALLDSERELITLRATQVLARGRLAQAQVNLFRALGGRWQTTEMDVRP
ncbi:TolC family protein [Pseudomonas sp. RAC1]|uniref:TolC family protein n=1 Tax=Pseudomonas sp. RAC1 TaxID=3064900 RepID=UPI00272792AC|nr:TolC family protein [Pseudomonas sp. RAC1]MDV9031174.1 TolC family protein [Pseudomonas sp. RAC1]